jgi:HlyD family secretion protein
MHVLNRFRGWLGGIRRRWFMVGALTVAVGGLPLYHFGTAQAKHEGPVESATVPSVSQPPEVQVVQPQLRKIVREVGQPSFVESYERTSIYPKVSGYIEKWNVDIGDKVKKGDVLATLYVPELREDWQTKLRTVTLDKKRVKLAEKVVRVAQADVRAAQARLDEARATLAQYESQVHRWAVQVKRLTREVNSGVVDNQVLTETQNQLEASTAARDAARAAIAKAEAELVSRQETLEQDKVNVEVARSQKSVADSDAKRLEAWVGYLTLRAPYDGVIVARNVNTWDFVRPAAGDPSADPNSPNLAPGGTAAPLYVMDRTDVVRIFVDIPEADANFVHPGTKASVLVRAFRDYWIPATVTRTSWALNVKSRTLRAEIDLRNSDHPDDYRDPGSHPIAAVSSHDGLQILPGMYAYGKVIIERPNVWALPKAALNHAGDDTWYWGYANGHAVKAPVETGVSDGEWVEVTNRRSASGWTPIDGSEQVVLGEGAALSDGTLVRTAPAGSSRARPGAPTAAEPVNLPAQPGKKGAIGA